MRVATLILLSVVQLSMLGGDAIAREKVRVSRHRSVSRTLTVLGKKLDLRTAVLVLKPRGGAKATPKSRAPGSHRATAPRTRQPINAQLLGRARSLAPDIVPRLRGQRTVARGRLLSRIKRGSLAFVQPWAVESFRRQVFRLNAEGITHGAISIQNVRLTKHGTLVLVGWHSAKVGGDVAKDMAGVDAIARHVSQL